MMLKAAFVGALLLGGMLPTAAHAAPAPTTCVAPKADTVHHRPGTKVHAPKYRIIDHHHVPICGA